MKLKPDSSQFRVTTVRLPDSFEDIHLTPAQTLGLAAFSAFDAIVSGDFNWCLVPTETIYELIISSQFTKGLVREIRESKVSDEDLQNALAFWHNTLVSAEEWGELIGKDYLGLQRDADDNEWDSEQPWDWVGPYLDDMPKRWRKNPILLAAIEWEVERYLCSVSQASSTA